MLLYEEEIMTAKPKRRVGPKFRVGQVVRIKTAETLFEIGNVVTQDKIHYYWDDSSNSLGFAEKQLRPLTAREIGPSPKRRPKGKR